MKNIIDSQPKVDSNQPFENIALCISGGGFRAAGYGLGVISYLRQAKFSDNTSLLEKVTYLSTTSGGSLLAALYMKSIIRNEPFEDFYQKAISFMDGEELLKKALKKLSNKSEWVDSPKNRNLINSFAKVYNDALDGQLFGEYFEGKDQRQIKENCYNSTEFNTGITFRFKTEPIIGNRYIKLSKEAASQLKVADIIAASSCFPAGFEPLIFPNDFATNQEEITFINRNLSITDPYGQSVNPPFALMDGGITDNQGIESMMLANEKKRFSLVILADVSNKFMSPWQPPMQSKQTDKWSINKYDKILNLMPWAFVLAIILLCFDFTNKLGLVLLLPTLLGTLLQIQWRSVIKSIKSIFDTDNSINWDTIMSKYLNYCGSLPFKTLSYLLKVRLTSVSMLAYDIFLKQVRRMRYEELYENADWNNKRISSLIYELVELNNKNIQAELRRKIREIIQDTYESKEVVETKITDEFDRLWKVLSPNRSLMNMAQVASSMGTTLWFDRDDVNQERLNKIIATGQFTTCFNVLEYILLAELRSPNQFTYGDIKTKLLNDWAKFNTNPLWLIEQNNQ